MTESQIASKPSVLIDLKLEAYFNLVNTMQEYLRIAVIHKRTNYPIDKWVLALINLYNKLYNEVSDNKKNPEYSETFDWIENGLLKLLESGISIEYRSLLARTRVMMKFSDFVGVSKIHKFKSEKPKGGILNDR